MIAKNNKIDEEILSTLLYCISTELSVHKPGNSFYNHLLLVARNSILNLYGQDKENKANLGFLGEINLPYFSMGAIDSTHLFGLDELILFSFYNKNKHLYSKVSDLGANIGLHSIVLSNLGYRVTSYEPDPIHFEVLTQNVNLNSASNINLINKAVSTQEGQLEFIRVLGNTTGSHLAGSKDNPYGNLTKFKVDVVPFLEICKDSDLIKIDVEGHEATILLSTVENDWLKTDAIVEVGNQENSKQIFKHFKKIGINLFSQKKSWGKVYEINDMPSSYKEGSLFISKKEKMPW